MKQSFWLMVSGGFICCYSYQSVSSLMFFAGVEQEADKEEDDDEEDSDEDGDD